MATVNISRLKDTIQGAIKKSTKEIEAENSQIKKELINLTVMPQLTKQSFKEDHESVIGSLKSFYIEKSASGRHLLDNTGGRQSQKRSRNQIRENQSLKTTLDRHNQRDEDDDHSHSFGTSPLKGRTINLYESTRTMERDNSSKSHLSRLAIKLFDKYPPIENSKLTLLKSKDVARNNNPSSLIADQKDRNQNRNEFTLANVSINADNLNTFKNNISELHDKEEFGSGMVRLPHTLQSRRHIPKDFSNLHDISQAELYSYLIHPNLRKVNNDNKLDQNQSEAPKSSLEITSAESKKDRFAYQDIQESYKLVQNMQEKLNSFDQDNTRRKKSKPLAHKGEFLLYTDHRAALHRDRGCKHCRSISPDGHSPNTHSIHRCPDKKQFLQKPFKAGLVHTPI